MTRDLVVAATIALFGVVLAVHFLRAGVREWCGGVAEGHEASYARATEPVRFWATIVVTAAAGPLRLALVAFTVATAIGR